MKPSFLLFHPAFVHFPIAFYFAEMGLWIAWAAKQDDIYQRFAGIAFRWGYALMFVAVVTGFISAGGSKGITGAVAQHFSWAAACFVFYSGRAFYRPARGNGWIQMMGSITGSILLALASYYGGKLVYS